MSNARMKDSISRRRFISGSMVASAAAGLAGPTARAATATAPSPGKAALPTGMIGNLTLSRLISGGT